MPRRFTANDICRAIDALDKNRLYSYVNPNNHGEIKIVSVNMPDGPIQFQRRRPGEAFERVECMSAEMLWRCANALSTGLPVNVERIFGGSYNTRSVLEALLAHTPEIYFCYPGRQENKGDVIEIKRGHKHIVFRDNVPHAQGQMKSIDLGENCVISEVPVYDNAYDVVPAPLQNSNVDIAIRRRHSQIQICLYGIARAMNMRTWLAVQDHGIVYNGHVITEHPAVVHSLQEEPTLSPFPNAIRVANNIDCLYFNGGLPYAFEVEHSTGVTSGLTRMLSFRNQASHLRTQYVIVAPDEDREKVMMKAQPEQFDDIRPLFFPYSQVEDLYSFVNRHGGRLNGVKKEDFLLNFMESCRAA